MILLKQNRKLFCKRFSIFKSLFHCPFTGKKLLKQKSKKILDEYSSQYFCENESISDFSLHKNEVFHSGFFR